MPTQRARASSRRTPPTTPRRRTRAATNEEIMRQAEILGAQMPSTARTHYFKRPRSTRPFGSLTYEEELQKAIKEEAATNKEIMRQAEILGAQMPSSARTHVLKKPRAGARIPKTKGSRDVVRSLESGYKLAKSIGEEDMMRRVTNNLEKIRQREIKRLEKERDKIAVRILKKEEEARELEKEVQRVATEIAKVKDAKVSFISGPLSPMKEAELHGRYKGRPVTTIQGSGLLDGLAVKAIPFLSKAAPLIGKVAAPLATGAVTALGSLGVDKLFGGGVYVPKGKVKHLLEHLNELTPTQRRDIAMATQMGSGVTIRPTKKQRGGFLGSLLASMVIGKLLGGGLQNRTPRGMSMMPYVPPLALGSGGKKKRTGKGLLLGKRSPFSGIPLLGAIL